jgi:hypothetical protein
MVDPLERCAQFVLESGVEDLARGVGPWPAFAEPPQ